MKKAPLESLHSEKFAKATVSPEIMVMVKAGGASGTSEHLVDGKKLTDSYSYSCCGGRYDCYTKFSDGSSYNRMSLTIFDGTTPDMY
ncbi:hypothetical protein [Taibaiella koreensis]|uniref:hypothetical protein n=1 Tax=Taibaiella koreensis TaxID=1268548 RepID=UPI000E59FB33|nr:hypothetical protein [Taibaiella koreensis]